MLSAPRNDLAGARGDAGGGPLENTANNSSPDLDGRLSRRRSRWLLRSLLWRGSSLQRVRHCGRVTRMKGSGVTVRSRDGIAGYAGLQHCGSVWSCPVCSAQILTHRALEIGSVLGQAVTEGRALGFGTFTMRHRQGQRLAKLWDSAGRAWGRATSGGSWQRVKLAYGVEGWVRVWEVTDGRNGWHVHVHFVVVLPGDATSADLDAVCRGMYERWSRGLVAAGLEAPRLVGQEWHLATGDGAAGDLAEYLFKLTEQAAPAADRARSLGLELAHTMPGRSRSDLRTRPVWSVLEEAANTGDLSRWQEWEAGSLGRRQVGWSAGLRKRFAPQLDDVSDEEITDQEHGSADDGLVVITDEGWRKLCRTPAVLPMLLEVAEQAGALGLVDALTALDVPHHLYEREAA